MGVDLERVDRVCADLEKLCPFDSYTRGRITMALAVAGYQLQKRNELSVQAQRYRALFGALQALLKDVRNMSEATGLVEVESRLTTLVERAPLGRLRDRARESLTHRARQKARGLCAHCARPIRKPGASRCETHWKKHKAASERWRRENR